MTVYTADPIPMKAVSGAESFEKADTINTPRYLLRPVVLDFTWSPVVDKTVTIGLDTVTLHGIGITVPIVFTATTTLPRHRSVVNYEWKFGDGTVVQTSNPVISHKYEVSVGPGVRVSLVITDDLGNTYSCGHQLYIFVALDSPIGTWTWDGTPGESHTPGHPPDMPTGALLFDSAIVESFTPGRLPDHPFGILYFTGETTESFTPGVPTDHLSGNLLLDSMMVESYTAGRAPDAPSGILYFTGEPLAP